MCSDMSQSAYDNALVIIYRTVTGMVVCWEIEVDFNNYYWVQTNKTLFDTLDCNYLPRL